MATVTMLWMDKIRWDSTHTACLGTKPLEHIPWDEFRDVFNVLLHRLKIEKEGTFVLGAKGGHVCC